MPQYRNDSANFICFLVLDFIFRGGIETLETLKQQLANPDRSFITATDQEKLFKHFTIFHHFLNCNLEGMRKARVKSRKLTLFKLFCTHLSLKEQRIFFSGQLPQMDNCSMLITNGCSTLLFDVTTVIAKLFSPSELKNFLLPNNFKKTNPPPVYYALVSNKTGLLGCYFDLLQPVISKAIENKKQAQDQIEFALSYKPLPSNLSMQACMNALEKPNGIAQCRTICFETNLAYAFVRLPYFSFLAKPTENPPVTLEESAQLQKLLDEPEEREEKSSNPPSKP